MVISREFLLVDATDREERVMEGQMMIAMNINREICTIQMNGGLCLEKDQVNENILLKSKILILLSTVVPTLVF